MRDVTTAWQRVARTLDQALANVIRHTGVLAVGLAGPPGSGKSTLASGVAHELRMDGDDPLIISLDDFYLTRNERLERGIPWRGPPGTHDVPALLAVLDQIRGGRAPITVPRFSAEIDDRIDPEVLARTPKHVLVEGWVLGYRGDGYGAILDRLDLLVFLDVPEEVARARRFAREQELRDRGGGFSVEDMERFWDEVLGPGIPRWVRAAKESSDLVLEMDEDELRRVWTSSERVMTALQVRE